MSTKQLFWIAPLVFMAACAGGSNDSSPRSYASTESTVAADSASTEAGAPLTSPQRKVIRTADLRCKVKNVFTATTAIEQLVRSVGGIVQDSHLENIGSDVENTYYTEDSLRQTQTFTTTATLTLRVPVAFLDSIVQSIPGMTSFIDARSLKQNDVTYRYMANDMKNRIGNSGVATSRAMQLARKSNDPLDVQAYENEREEKKIDRKLKNLQIIDDVTYATVTVALSQPTQIYTQIVVDPSYYNENPFALRCRQALYSGWSFLKGFIIGIINIWPILLMAPIIWLLVRKLRLGRFVIVRK